MGGTEESVQAVSIHAPREGCDDTDDLRRRSFDVSIHAPREGCDDCNELRTNLTLLVSIHAPREGCDH